MLTSITLQNFKVFKEKTTFPLSKINLLTGTNGSGKSSLLQSMLLLKQSLEDYSSVYSINLKGNCIDLGVFEDIKNIEVDNQDKILIGYKYENNSKLKSDGTLMLHSQKFEHPFSSHLIITQIDYCHNIEKYSSSKKREVLLESIDGVFKYEDGAYVYTGNKKDLENLPFTLDYFTPKINGIDKIQQFYGFNFVFVDYISASRIAPKNVYNKYAESKDNADILTILSNVKYYKVNDVLCLDKGNKSFLY